MGSKATFGIGSSPYLLQQHIAFASQKLDTAVHGLISRFGFV
jgi:hypothetical protein